jgi:hypothetical protein
VVGPNGTPEKGNRAEIKKEKQPGEIFAMILKILHNYVHK